MDNSNGVLTLKTLVFFLRSYTCRFLNKFCISRDRRRKEKDCYDDSRNSSSTDRNAGFFFVFMEKSFACRYSR
ncbi:hypothetical protein BDE02_15G097800 [Populus trichocarpa]|nr:hypothetical protein BDE02_15G097800 [Populus trichocarpa]